MTITIDRPQAPKALSSEDGLRRREAAVNYYDARREAKFLRAYVAMSPFMLNEFAQRLEASLASEQGSRSRHNRFRLDVVREAQIEHRLAGFRLPTLGDIPKGSPLKFRRRFLKWGIQTINARLEELKSKNSNQIPVLRERRKEFETALRSIGTTVKATPSEQPNDKQTAKKNKAA